MDKQLIDTAAADVLGILLAFGSNPTSIEGYERMAKEIATTVLARAIEAEVRTEAQEPVMWMWRRRASDKWEVVTHRWDDTEESNALEMEEIGWEVVRLYAAPQPPAPCPICADKDWYGIDALQAKVAELEAELTAQKEWAECYKAQSKAEMSEQAALIEKCEKALASAVEWGVPMQDSPKSSRPEWFELVNAALAAIAAMKGGAK